MSSHHPFAGPDVDFGDLAAEVELHQWRREVEVESIPSPPRLAPNSLALAADVLDGETEVGNGRLVLLHDPAGNEAWQGTLRLVSFARAEVDPEMGNDPLLPEVGWSWLTDALAVHGARHLAASGTVTAVSSRSFGEMGDQPDRVEVEIRASWTPRIDARHPLAAHLAAWQELLCHTAGLPALSAGVVALGARTGRMR